MVDQLLAGRSLLVVEDEMLVMMGIEDMLSDLGCTSIRVAGSAIKALELIAANAFDFALLDVNLNGQRSYPVASALAERGVPFAFSTGYGEHGVDDGFGDRPVLTKPFGSHQLVTMLAEVLALPTEPSIKTA